MIPDKLERLYYYGNTYNSSALPKCTCGGHLYELFCEFDCVADRQFIADLTKEHHVLHRTCLNSRYWVNTIPMRAAVAIVRASQDRSTETRPVWHINSQR